MAIILYSRPRCPLCDGARLALESAGIDFKEVDVSAELRLEREFGSFVPVVEVDGRLVFDGGMNPQSLVELIAEAKRTLA